MTKPAESTMTVERLAAVAAHYAPEGLDLEAAMDNVYTNAKGVVMYVPPEAPADESPETGSGEAPDTQVAEESGAGDSANEAHTESVAAAQTVGKLPTTVGRAPRVVRAVGGTAPPAQKSSDTMSDAELVDAFDQLRTAEIQQMAPA